MTSPAFAPASPPRILVAGIGNIFLGDDAFGVEVARKLLCRPEPWPAHVRVEDFGIRGIDLVYALADGCDWAILIDAVPRRDGPPGTLYLLEPDQSAEGDSSPPLIEAHALDPVKALRTAAAMGPTPPRLRQAFIVGCQPMAVGGGEDGEQLLGLSPPVAAAVDEAVKMVEELIEKICAGPQPGSQAANRQEVQSCHG